MNPAQPNMTPPPPSQFVGQPNGAAPPPESYPPNPDTRHAAIHADGAKGAEDAAHLTGYEGTKVGAATNGAAGPTANPPASGGDASPPVKAMWAPLFGALLALFASVGGNVFLGWTAVSMRGRYRALLAHQQAA